MKLTIQENRTLSKLLKLDTLAYFYGFSHNGYQKVSYFVNEAIDSFERGSTEADHYETLFNGACPDEKTGIWDLVYKIRDDEELMNMKIVYDSSVDDSSPDDLPNKKYTSLCLTEDKVNPDGSIHRNIYVILNGNYGAGIYDSDGDGADDIATWVDNALGGVQKETPEQKNILQFYDKSIEAAKNAPKDGFEDESEDADKVGLSENDTYSIIVSGHSKGGNLAQYTTIMRDDVDECYSFDGQGFSDSFINDPEIAEKINRNGTKITNIYPQLSFVGSLFNPIENANSIFIDTGICYIEYMPEYTILGYHIPTSLFDSDSNMKSSGDGFLWFSELVRQLSIKTIRIADEMPNVDAENGLRNLGYILLESFKPNPNDELLKRYLFNQDTQGIILWALALGNISLPAIFVKAVETIVTQFDSWVDFWKTVGYSLYDLFNPKEDIEITGSSGDETLNGNGKSNFIYGYGGNDTLNGDDGDDYLEGGAGEDTLNGNDGNDYLDGGEGDDYLDGGDNNDTYVYGKGYGNDIIIDSNGENKIKFTNLSPDDMTVYYPTGNNDAILTITETGETLTINNFWLSDDWRNFTFEFSNETYCLLNFETGEFERIPSDDEIAETDSVPTADELAQANADILDELYGDENSVSDLLTESDNTVIPEITDSAFATDENNNTADQIDVQVMILTENMAAFSNESNISDSLNIQNNVEDFEFANQLLVGTQAS